MTFTITPALSKPDIIHKSVTGGHHNGQKNRKVPSKYMKTPFFLLIAFLCRMMTAGMTKKKVLHRMLTFMYKNVNYICVTIAYLPN